MKKGIKVLVLRILPLILSWERSSSLAAGLPALLFALNQRVIFNPPLTSSVLLLCHHGRDRSLDDGIKHE